MLVLFHSNNNVWQELPNFSCIESIVMIKVKVINSLYSLVTC